MASQLTSGNVRLDDVKQLVENLNIFTLDTHNFFESAGSVKPLDLPLVDSPAGGFLKCFVDIISDVSDFPPTEIKQALVSKKIHDLPAPYGLTQKIDLPTKLDIAIIKQNNGTFCVVKIVNLKEKVKVSRVQNLCYGKCQAVDWVGDIKAVKKCLHYMFECLGGFQCRQHLLRFREEGKPEADRTPEEWDFGFARTGNFVGSPRKLPGSNLPSTNGLNPSATLLRMVSSHKSMKYGLSHCHGLPGAGKTPVARTLAMAISRYWIHKAKKEGEIAPSFRQACEFDFFRGQAGSQMRPDLFADGTLSDQPFRKVKAFTDVGNIESMSKERQDVLADVLDTVVLKHKDVRRCFLLLLCRWGAAKWAKGQTRIYCVNEFEENTEPKLDQPLIQQAAGIPTYVSHDEFLKMLEPSWYPKENSNANVMAVLRRTHIFLNTATSLCVRSAGEKPCPVLRHPLGDKTDYLHQDSRSVYDYHRKGGTDLPDDFETKLQWESNWFTKAMNGDTAGLKYRATILHRRPSSWTLLLQSRRVRLCLQMHFGRPSRGI
eukprot:s62_g30.t1